MNIFDGHENKSPEELAKELGISDLSVIENAGREVIETLKTDYKKNISEKKVEETSLPESLGYDANNARTNDYIIGTLKFGMEVNINNGDIWKIKDIENNHFLVEQTDSDGSKQKTTIEFEDLKESFQISVMEKERTLIGKRISLSDIKDLYKSISDDLIVDGTYVRQKSSNNFLEAIAKAKKNFTSTKNYNLDFSLHLEKQSENSFIENFAIHKSYFAQYQVKNFTGKDIAPITSLEDIPVGTRLININHISYSPTIKTVKTIGVAPLATNDDDITLQYGKSYEVVSAKNITNGDYFYLKEGGTEEEIDVNDDELWAKNCNFDELREGMRINIFSLESIEKIWKINQSSKTIVMESFHKGESVLKFSDIGTNFSVYSEDLREANKENFVEIGITREKLKDDSLWISANNIDSSKLKEGMRVRKAGDGLMSGDGGKIGEINVNSISINYVSEKNGHIYLSASEFEVLKEDLEEPKRTNFFEIQQLTKGIKVTSKNRDVYGTIVEINEEKIIITDGNTLKIALKDFVKDFKVDSRNLISIETILTGLTKAEIADNSLWESFNYENWTKAEEGMRIRKDGFGGVITKNNGDTISIKYVNSKGESVVDIGINIEIYKEDLENNTNDKE